MTTATELAKLEQAYARGVLKVREGDTWLEYQSMKEMATAIDRLRSEIGGNRPSGSRRVSVSKGY